jgi:cytochrome oxidase Cu insertion factor (SCO1/SenC/PrrC family)
VGDFRLTERDGRSVGLDELRGKVWIASFVFTRCTGPCPQISGTMARLQSELADAPDLRLVTFTVDPAHDQPDELRRYADHFHADPTRWLFLTGSEAEVYRLVHDTFHMPAEQNVGTARKDGAEVMHDQRLALVDRKGRIRGYFNGARDPDRPDDDGFEDNLKRLRDKTAALLREAP